MSLPDYYKILQVPVTATSAEIKAAYRRLAKIYHPDKSTPHANEERFRQIKEAYEHLVDPQRRARYDAKRSRATTFSKSSDTAKKTPGKKNYSFTEEEARRRQYYQQHYTKTQTKKPAPGPAPVKQPNELKFVLISVPIAVALLLLIIRIYERPMKEPRKLSELPGTENASSDITTGEMPYRGIFGKPVYDTASAPVIRFVNRSGYDALVFLRNDSNHTLRHHFLENNFQLYAEQLPKGKYHLYYWLGDSFSYQNYLFTSIIGNYRKTVSVDSARERTAVVPARADTFTIVLENKNKVDTALLRRIFFSR
jgi:hypothetical protein